MKIIAIILKEFAFMRCLPPYIYIYLKIVCSCDSGNIVPLYFYSTLHSTFRASGRYNMIGSHETMVYGRYLRRISHVTPQRDIFQPVSVLVSADVRRKVHHALNRRRSAAIYLDTLRERRRDTGALTMNCNSSRVISRLRGYGCPHTADLPDTTVFPHCRCAETLVHAREYAHAASLLIHTILLAA